MKFNLSHWDDTAKAHLQMHLSIILWGVTGVIGRGIDLNEGLLVWYRLILVTVSLFVYIRWQKLNLRLSKALLKRLFIVGNILMVHWLCFYGAIKYSNVSVTLSLFASTTLFTALLNPFFTGQKLHRGELGYSLLAMLGIAIIFYTDTNEYNLGILLALLAAFIGAFFNILNKSVVATVPSSVISFYEIGFGLVLLTLIMPFYLYLFPTEKLTPNLTDWGLLLILSFVCTHVTMILSLNALRHLSPFTLNLAINLEPVYGITLAFLIFKENKQLNLWFFIGTCIILLSVLLHSWQTKKKKPT